MTAILPTTSAGTSTPEIPPRYRNRDLRIGEDVQLLHVTAGLYRLHQAGRLLGWVERNAPRGWWSRLPDADEVLPDLHMTRRIAAFALLDLAGDPEPAPAGDWPVVRNSDGTWVIHCTRIPCPSKFGTHAANEVDAFLQARDKGWGGEDWPVCPQPHLFLTGGLS